MHPADSIWWHVYPLGFAGAPIGPAASSPDDPQPPTPGDGLRRITAWLDYAANLGFTGLLLGPIFSSSTHGYDTVDYRTIDPRLGTMEDFTALAEACHQRGIALALDGVFNHVGAAHRWVSQALAAGPEGAADAMVAVDWTGDTPRLSTFEGHEHLVTLNHASPLVVKEVASIMRWWLDRGADAWRLDAAYAAPANFWRHSIGAVRETHPDAWFLGEVLHGDYAEFVTASGADTVTQYELWKAIWSSIADRNLFELDWTLRRHATWCGTFAPATFVGNHDVTRIASRVGVDGAIAAVWLLMMLPGTPFVYYGDEVGMTGFKEDRAGGDDAVRPAYAAVPPGDWASDADAARVLQAHADAIAMRHAHPWLARATMEVVAVTNEHLTYDVRGESVGQALRVEVDLAVAPLVTVTAAGTP